MFTFLLAALAFAETPETAVESNVSFQAALTFADGHSVQGKVIRVERGQDVYAEQGWVDSSAKLLVELEGNGTAADKPWTDIASLDIKYGARGDVDCLYESEFTPWMYTCTLKTTSTAKTTDGKSWEVTGRHKWKFTFVDGQVVEFFAFKLPARRQDTDQDDTIGGDSSENAKLYGELQAEAVEASKKALTKLVITR